MRPGCIRSAASSATHGRSGTAVPRRLRRFWRGDDRSVSGAATRLLGSPDLYGHENREAEQSINFVACHDGFTLNDVVSYNRKHNEANGENNRDGADDNISWNCGIEGPTGDPAVEALRNRQVKNFLSVLMLAAGTPDAADGRRSAPHASAATTTRIARTTKSAGSTGSCVERHADIHRFVRELAGFRQRRESWTRTTDAQPESAAAARAPRVARGRTGPPRLGRTIAFDGVHVAHASVPVPVSRDAERLLGAAHVRDSSRREGRVAPVAQVHRHGGGAARRHQPVGGGAGRTGRTLCRAAAFPGSARGTTGTRTRQRHTSTGR